MSNNIYDILKKMQNLEAPKQSLTESKKAKPDFADLDKDGDKKEPMKKAAKEKNKGAIAEAVARVEKNLAEKYVGFKKKLGEAGDKLPAPPDEVHLPKKGSKHGPVDVYRKKTNEAEVEESGLQAYLGKKKYGEQGMKALQKAGRDGASKEKMAMIRARHDKMDEGDYNEDMLSPAQKKFAALAEPKDKITYADKIAGAKKKTEGNKFSGNLMKARAQGLKQADLDGDGEMEPVREGFPTVADAEKRMKEREGKTSHGKKTVTSKGVKHERDYDAVDRGADVDTTPKGRGRPKKDKFA